MNYDQHEFAIQSSFYGSHSKQLSHKTILNSIQMFENAIEYFFHTIELKFNSRQLFVLFEKELNCEVATDHLTSKNIFPIYSNFFHESKKNLIAIQNAQVVYQLEKTFYELIQHELQLRLQAEFKLNQESIKAKQYFNQVNSLTETNQMLLVQLAEMKALYQKFEQMTKEQFNLKLKIGKMYRPDFWDVNMLDRNSQGGNNLNLNQDTLISQLRKQILQLQNEKEELQRKLDYYLTQILEIPGYQKLIQQLKDEIERLLRIISEFSNQNNTVCGEMQQQIDQLTLLNDQLRSEVERLKGFEDEYWKLKALYDALLKKYQDQLAELQRQIDSLNAQIQLLTTENDRLTQENQDLINRNKYLKEQNDKLSAINEQLIKDNELLKEELIINQRKSGKSQNISRGLRMDEVSDIQRIKNRINERLHQDQELALVVDLIDHCRKYQKVIQSLTGLEVSLEDTQMRQMMRRMISEDNISEDVLVSISKLKIPDIVIKKAIYLYKNRPDFKSSGQQCQILMAGQPGVIINDQIHNNSTYEDNSFRKSNSNHKDVQRSSLLTSQLTSLSTKSPLSKEAISKHQLLNDLDHAQSLIENARQYALQSLDKYQDASVQTEQVDFYEGERKARASRAFNIARKYLKMSKFTLKYAERDNNWDIPEVFKRLYNAAAEIKERRRLLAEEIYLQESRILDRTIQKDYRGGMNIDSILLGQSLLKVEKGNNETQKSQVLYDLPASGQKFQKKGVYGTKTTGSGDLKDTELMTAIFGGTREKTFNMTLRDSK